MPAAYRRAVDSMIGIRGCRPQPLRDHGQSHHDIANEDRHVRHRRFEHRWHTRRQDQRAGDLHEHREPVGHIVAVVGRGEPGEVHPRPPDGEEDHQVAEEALECVRLRDGVVQPARRLGDGDNEDEVEEELERRRGAVWLVRRARPHRADHPRSGSTHVADGCRFRHLWREILSRSPRIPGRCSLNGG